MDMEHYFVLPPPRSSMHPHQIAWQFAWFFGRMKRTAGLQAKVARIGVAPSLRLLPNIGRAQQRRCKREPPIFPSHSPPRATRVARSGSQSGRL